MKEKFDQLHETKSVDSVWALSGRYTREDLLKMDPVYLRALFRERIHHTIEVDIYPIALGKKKLPPNFGLQPQLILDVWKERGFPDDDPDIGWGKNYLALAAKLRMGKKVKFKKASSSPFTKKEMAVVHKLMWGRRSVRDFGPGKKISDEMVEKILEAGRAAPNGCNLNVFRFVVIRDPKEAKMVWSDIPIPIDRCVLIVVCYDKKVYATVGQDRYVPQNVLFDCAAAADHMCLMAHALGLGAVWLSCTAKTAKTFKEKYGLPDQIEQALHIAIGWPSTETIKSERMPLREMIVTRKKT